MKKRQAHTEKLGSNTLASLMEKAQHSRSFFYSVEQKQGYCTQLNQEAGSVGSVDINRISLCAEPVFRTYIFMERKHILSIAIQG